MAFLRCEGVRPASDASGEMGGGKVMRMNATKVGTFPAQPHCHHHQIGRTVLPKVARRALKENENGRIRGKCSLYSGLGDDFSFRLYRVLR